MPSDSKEKMSSTSAAAKDKKSESSKDEAWKDKPKTVNRASISPEGLSGNVNVTLDPFFGKDSIIVAQYAAGNNPLAGPLGHHPVGKTGLDSDEWVFTPMSGLASLKSAAIADDEKFEREKTQDVYTLLKDGKFISTETISVASGESGYCYGPKILAKVGAKGPEKEFLDTNPRNIIRKSIQDTEERLYKANPAYIKYEEEHSVYLEQLKRFKRSQPKKSKEKFPPYEGAQKPPAPKWRGFYEGKFETDKEYQVELTSELVALLTKAENALESADASFRKQNKVFVSLFLARHGPTKGMREENPQIGNPDLKGKSRDEVLDFLWCERVRPKGGNDPGTVTLTDEEAAMLKKAEAIIGKVKPAAE
jgi:hypothetical protein